MAVLADLVQTRTTLKTRLTKFGNFVNEFPTSKHSIFQLRERFNKTCGVLDEFIVVQDKIFVLNKDEEPDEITNFENNYYAIISSARELIESETAPSDAASLNIARDPDNNSSSGSVPTARLQVKLPTINLPSFSGAYDQWLQYRDAFLTLIHNNDSLSNVQKLHYLRSSLKGEPATTIQSLQITNANYTVAWELLTKRFENKRLIVNNYIKALCNIQTLTKESSSGLRKIYNTLYHTLCALNSLGVKTEGWDPILIYLTTSRFDPVNSREWESEKFDSDLPTLKELTTFLENRCQLLELFTPESSHKPIKHQPFRNYNQLNSHISTNRYVCHFCKKSHLIYHCEEFLRLQVPERIANAKQLNLCLNCLHNNHSTANCKGKLCRTCKCKHNTLLHLDKALQVIETSSNVSEGNDAVVATCNSTISSFSGTVLLATAFVYLTDSSGNQHKCRALLDSGSQSCFIRSAVAQLLKIPFEHVNMTVGGINKNNSIIKQRLTLTLSSCTSLFKRQIQCLVIPDITNYNTNLSINYEGLNIPDDITLADPQFYDVSNIDVLLGASIFWEIFCQGQIKLGRRLPTLQKTQLGWIISGPIHSYKYINTSSCHLSIATSEDGNLEDQIARFWTIEEVQTDNNWSADEEACELHFQKHHQRCPDGRFMVRLPFKHEFTELGNSKLQAERRLANIEQRLKRNSILCDEYTKFMNEYLQLGHMSMSTTNPANTFYLPHHAVMKQSSQTTKIRIVFDGSANSDSGKSINDLLLVGPTLQEDLLNIILRFRKHKYVVTADISKMYRQVLVHPADRKFQRILWRTGGTIETFELNTVTYGTTPASFLAIRCLMALAETSANQYPMASNIIKHDFYVDDMLTGTNDENELFQIYKEVSTILLAGGFELRKWCSNSSKFMKTIERECTMDNAILEIGKHEEVKTLGLNWAPESDKLQFAIYTSTTERRVTKRIILSNIAQIFDPLGLVAPVIIVAKIIMQRIWQLKLNWDDSVPLDIYTQWNDFKEKLQSLNLLRIPRCLLPSNSVDVELHGFSDASEQAYGACIYMRASVNNTNTTSLICAKSRVAPLKTMSIPRLELCGAVLLARLSEKVQKALSMKFHRIIHWTDSTIVLSWINKSPSCWKTFVANRVSTIQHLSKHVQWSHVRTDDNPADLLSRGIRGDYLSENNLWWNGPIWLQDNSANWPASNIDVSSLSDPPEGKNILITNLATRHIPISTIFQEYSSYMRLLRMTAYCLRFARNSKIKNKTDRVLSELTTDEISQSRIVLVRLVQAGTFAPEVNELTNKKIITKNKRLRSLSLFLDQDKIIRVGGRLRLSHHPYDKRHPILLPDDHPFTTLVIRHTHFEMMHSGPQLTLAAVRECYWPINGRNRVRSIIQNCVVCFRAKPANNANLMGDLPPDRIQHSLPFAICGVDYAGPYFIKDRNGRGSKQSKCYLSLFVCFTTKAIHIELVGSLTTESFIACLRRFAARRGKPEKIYSDNATNFVGAHNELDQLTAFFKSESSTIIQQASNVGIDWKFIPPRAPHFGGLWEAGVKAVKHHLNRVLKDTVLTYENFYTLLVQIESCLNSRPLCPLSNDPNDLDPLTPAHLLIGRNLQTVPNPSMGHIADNRLSSFQKIQQILEHFWKRWHVEYLGELQKRNKWTSEGTQLRQGMLVVLHEDNIPPNHWHLGRIIETHPGRDDRVRVVTVSTKGGIVKRASKKIYILPIQIEDKATLANRK